MATHYFSNAVQTKKKLAKSNGDSTSQEEIQKMHRRHSTTQLQKQKRSLQMERYRDLTSVDCWDYDLNLPVEKIDEALKQQYQSRLMMGCGDVVDCGLSHSNGNALIANHDEIVSHCLQSIRNKLQQESTFSNTTSIPDVNFVSSVNSHLIQFLVQNPQCSTVKAIALLLQQQISEQWCDMYPSNKSLCLEMVDTLYFITQLANSEQIQSMAETFVHEPLLAILAIRGNVDLVLWTKTFLCLSFIASHCRDLRLHLIEKAFASMILKHSHNSSLRDNNDTVLAYSRSIAYSLRVFTRDIGEKRVDHQFASEVLQSLNNLMQLTDDLVLANVYWSLSEMAFPGSLFNSEYVLTSKLTVKLMEALKSHKSDLMKEAAITCIATITAFDGEVANVVNNCDFVCLDVIEPLIQSNSSVVQYETVVTLTHLVNSNPSITPKLTQSGIIGVLLELLYLGEYKSQKQLTNLLLSIVMKGSPEDAMELLKGDVIKSLSSQLKVTEPDLILTTLKIYEHLLQMEKKRIIVFDVAEKCEQCGVVDIMDNLTTHPNQVIADTCYHIYDNYLDAGDVNSSESMQSKTYNF